MPEPQGTSTRLKRPSQPLWDGHSHAYAIVETVRQPLLVLDGDLRVKSANRSFYETFRVSPQETQGRLIYELGNRRWDIPKLRELLEKILPQDGQVEDFEVEHDFPAVGRKTMLLNARRLRQEGASAELILLAEPEAELVRRFGERGSSPQEVTLAYQAVLRVLSSQSGVEPPLNPTVCLARILARLLEEYQRRLFAIGSKEEAA